MCTLEQYTEQTTDIKAELKDVQTGLLNTELAAKDPIVRTQHEIEQTIFQCSVAIRNRPCALREKGPLLAKKIDFRFLFLNESFMYKEHEFQVSKLRIFPCTCIVAIDSLNSSE